MIEVSSDLKHLIYLMIELDHLDCGFSHAFDSTILQLHILSSGPEQKQLEHLLNTLGESL